MPAVAPLLQRARSMLGQGTLYWLGQGGQEPEAPSAAEDCPVGRLWPTLAPADRAMLAPLAKAAGIDVDDPGLVMPACDCSGFVCWALGFARRLPPAPYTSADGWVSTDTIWADAMGRGVRFQRLPRAVAGALVVYPREGSHESHGHVGIVTAVDGAGAASQVIHCSANNFKQAPWDSIKETAPTAFAAQPRSVYAWCRTLGTAPV